MNREQRKAWVQRGFKDPVAAFREHIYGAKERGIPFRMSFEDWWEMWEPHYEKRGTRQGQMCMCRHLDQGAYEVGNVRIDLNKSNHQERFLVQKINSAPTAHWQKGLHRTKPPCSTEGEWMWRGDVFREYSEEGIDD